MDIVKLIRENLLIHYTVEELIDELQKLTNEDADLVRAKVNTLISDGVLFLDNDERVSISADRGFLSAKLVLNKKGYGFAQVKDMVDIFIPAYAINGAFNNDDCLIEITNWKSEESIEGKVVRVLRRNTTHVVGTYIEAKGKNLVYPDDTRIPTIRIPKEAKSSAQNNDKVWVELDSEILTDNMMRGHVVEILGKANTPRAEQLAIIRSFNLDERFDPATLNQTKAINQTVNLKNYKDREDYTEQKVITIDGEDARDFDDALAVERKEDGGYILYVHIADVSEYVTENSPLDKEAYRRGTSVYFPNMVIPMLPKELSNGICSLQENENRLTLSVKIDLDKDAKVMSYEIKEAIIKSSHRMTYTEVEKILNGDELLIEKYADVYDDILAYKEISEKLKSIRRNRGEMRFNIPEPFILENENGEIVSIEKRIQDDSHEIIESLMILTNECVAEKFFKMQIPFVYRVHEKPDSMKAGNISKLLNNLGVANTLDEDFEKPENFQKILDKLKGSPKEEFLSKLILRAMMKARYDESCLGHFSLASQYYCHFTSPIRRYPDLMIHRIIKSYLRGVPILDLKLRFKDIVERASIHSSETEKNADDAERAVDDYKKCVYMEKFLGETFDAVISGVQEFGVFVELSNGIEGLVRIESLPEDNYTYDQQTMKIFGFHHNYTIGDEIEVQLSNTNPQLRQIDFVLPGVIQTQKVIKKLDDDKKKSKGKRKEKRVKHAKNYYDFEYRKSGKKKGKKAGKRGRR